MPKQQALAIAASANAGVGGECRMLLGLCAASNSYQSVGNRLTLLWYSASACTDCCPPLSLTYASLFNQSMRHLPVQRLAHEDSKPPPRLLCYCSYFWHVALSHFLQAVNLVLAAAATHKWYRRRFKAYPAARKALIPFLF
jgi:hypothetical protein